MTQVVPCAPTLNPAAEEQARIALLEHFRQVRNLVLLALSSRMSPLAAEVKSRYASIVGTNLQQISLGQVKRAIRQRYQFAVPDSIEAAPGITRCIIQKLSH